MKEQGRTSYTDNVICIDLNNSEARTSTGEAAYDGSGEPRADGREDTVRILRTDEELETIRPHWERWQTHPNNDLEFYRAIVQTRDNVISPYVAVIERDGHPVSIMICRLETMPLPGRLGYWSPVKVGLTTLTVLHQGFLGRVDDSVAVIFVAVLKDALQKGVADIVRVAFTDKGGVMDRAIRRYVPWYLHDYHSPDSLHWILRLPGTCDEAYREMHVNRRKWPRKKRQLERDFDCVRLDSFITPDDVPELCRHMETVTSRGYKRGMGVGFVDNDENRGRLIWAAERGGLRGFVLMADDRPVAYMIGDRYGDRMYMRSTDYDPAFRKYYPGHLVFYMMLPIIYEMDGNCTMDFGLGDALYKRQICTECWVERDTLIFPPTPAGLALNAVRTSLATATFVLQSMSDNMNVTSRIKRLWRDRFARRARERDQG